MAQPRPVIAAARRTVFGKYRGGLSNIRPDDLLGVALAELRDAIPRLDPAQVDDIIMGDANGAGEDNRNVARMGALLAGFPVSVPGVTLNRLCGSGAEAMVQAARAVRSGDMDVVIAGGVESMSRAPYVLPKSDQSLDPKMTLQQTTVGWRMVNPNFPSHWTDSLGECAQRSAEARGIGRAAQDEWAARSHELATAAWDAGLHDDFAFAVNGVERDESIRPDSTVARLAELRPAFTVDGTVTAGNSSPINDGAVTALITNDINARELGLEPMGTIVASSVVAVEPDEFAKAPVPAMHKLLSRTGLDFADIDLFEINEAFAAMVLTVLHDEPRIPVEKVNVHGGALAMGHPVGASAARVVIDAARHLKRRGGGRAIATACIGVGLGIAVLVEVP
ncbi:MAG: thiolase family protein [Actinomycetota bacterium]|nr:thiolase family protein [Actinomycetota bacterium]